MTQPLTALECELLEAVAQAPDDASRGVLADYWLERVDEARGAFVQLNVGDNAERIDLADEEARLSEFTRAWREPLVRDGYDERDLVLCHGFLETPIAVAAGDVLDGHPDIVRLSPRYYREKQILSDGVECIVYEGEAVTPRTTTRVALKRPRYEEDADVLVHEQTALQRIAHRNVVRARGYAIRPGGRTYVLEWSGIDVRKLVALARQHERQLGIDFAVAIGVQLCDALAAIHGAAVLHRELRGDHVAISADGTARVIDFGSARFLDDTPQFDRYARIISPGFSGDMRYRMRYLSPEQCRGMPLDEATDVFSLGGLLVEIATTIHPASRAATAFETLALIAREPLAVPAWLPPRLQVALRAALEPDPAQRCSVAQLRAGLLDAARADRLAIGPELVAQRLVEFGVPV